MISDREVEGRVDDRELTICDITQAFAETSGGVKTYLLAKQRYLLDETPHRPVLIVPGPDDRTRRVGRATIHEVAAPEIPGYAPYRFILRLEKVLRLLRREAPDVIEVGSPYLLPWAAFHHRRRHPACAVVGYYHCDFPSTYVETTLRGGNLAPLAGMCVRIAEWYARLVHRRYQVTLTGSPAMRACLERIGIDQIRMVPLGVDLETFHPERRDRGVWREFGLDPERPVLIYSGRLAGEKRVHLLVEALRLTDREDLQLAFVGEGPARSELLRKAAIDPRLHVLPYQPDPRALARLLASADLYVTAGPHETFGLSVVEAQACGLPVVGVRAGALVERVPPSVGRLGEEDSAEEFAQNIRTITSEDLPAIGARARQLVVDSFSWKKTFETLLGVYEETLASTEESARSSKEMRVANRGE